MKLKQTKVSSHHGDAADVLYHSPLVRYCRYALCIQDLYFIWLCVILVHIAGHRCIRIPQYCTSRLACTPRAVTVGAERQTGRQASLFDCVCVLQIYSTDP